jgi:TldD protein
MKRRDFVQLAGLGLGGLMLPLSTLGREVSVGTLLNPPLANAQKKVLADAALNTAKSLGASYADVRIGRYLNQFISTRENRVQNIVNTESFGTGVRVIVNGTWGFASTNVVTTEGIKKATQQNKNILPLRMVPILIRTSTAYGPRLPCLPSTGHPENLSRVMR